MDLNSIKRKFWKSIHLNLVYTNFKSNSTPLLWLLVANNISTSNVVNITDQLIFVDYFNGSTTHRLSFAYVSVYIEVVDLFGITSGLAILLGRDW